MIFDIIFNETNDPELQLKISVSKESMISKMPEQVEFVNLQNNEGLTAIHFAAFRGNSEIIKLLERKRADPYIRDKYGHNIIHISTQGDKVNAMHYLLKNFNFDTNDRDFKNSSPLHWAAYLNKEVALCYLLAWGANPNS